ncbi:hypothetical protein ACFX15_040530 [Malus domestica]
MNCRGAPLFCKIHEVHVQLKDYGGGSSEKKILRAQVALKKFGNLLCITMPRDLVGNFRRIYSVETRDFHLRPSLRYI